MDTDRLWTDAQKPDLRNGEMLFSENNISRWRLVSRNHIWRPPTDVYETDETVVVRVEIAGMREEDFVIEIDGRMLTIRGMRSDVQERRAYHQMEIRFGEFISEVELAVTVITTDVKATYNNGFLCLVFQKARPQQIHVSD